MSVDEKKRAVALHPDDAGLRVALAEALLADGDLLGAERQIEVARSRAPDDVRARLVELSLLSRQERHARAEAAALALLDARGDDAAALHGAAEAFFRMGRSLEAVIFAERAVELGELTPERLAKLGGTLLALGYAARALPHLTRARSLGASDLDDAIAAARLELDLGASSVLGRGRDVLLGRMRSTYRSAPLGPGLASVARAIESGELARVKRELALVDAPSKASPWFDVIRGDTLSCEGQHASALLAFERAASRDPGHELARARLAEAALHLGEPERARDALLGAPSRASSSLLEELLGDAQVALGCDDDAASAYERARALAPHGEAALKLSRLHARRVAPEPGRVFVLGWTPFGGSASPVEAVAVPGSGQLRITGNVTRDGREAAETAHTCLKARAKTLGIADRISNVDLHLRYDDSHTQKSGVSSGLALTLAGWSAIAERPLPRGLATTGEITLHGGVRPIDGLREKLAAALLAACPLVLYPRKNLLVWEKVPAVIRDRVNARPVDTLDEALSVMGLP